MRDLLTLLDQLNEATVANYPWGSAFLLSDGEKGQELAAKLEPMGVNVVDPMVSVDPETVDPATVSIQVGTGKTPMPFMDANETVWIFNGNPNSYFVHGGKLANRGEIAEGILGAAMFAKFTKRSGKEEIGTVTVRDIEQVLEQLQQVSEDVYQVDVQDADNKHADRVSFKLVLKTKPYQDLMNPANRDTLKNEFASAAGYVNSNMAERYSRYFYLNGKADDIAVIADGAASESSSKIDVWVAVRTPDGNMRRLKLNASLKAGPVKQFGQVGGSEDTSMIKLWDYFGIDVRPWVKEYNDLRGRDQFQAVGMMYKRVADKLSRNLKAAGVKSEVNFINDLAHAVTFFATLGDPGVELVQFDKGGFKILRFGNLAHKLNTVDLTATFVEGKARPEINIHDVHDPKNILVTIRAKIETKPSGDLYVRNIIEKGKLLEELTKVETKSWDDKAAEKHAEKIGTAHTIGGLRPKGTATPQKRGSTGIGRERR